MEWTEKSPKPLVTGGGKDSPLSTVSSATGPVVFVPCSFPSLIMVATLAMMTPSGNGRYISVGHRLISDEKSGLL